MYRISLIAYLIKVLALNKDRIERETFLIPLPYRISKPFLFLPPGVRLLLYLAFCLHATISSLCEVSEPLTSNHNATYSFGFHMTLRTKNRIKNRIKKGSFTHGEPSQAAAVKPIRERSDLLTPANASDSSLLLRHNSCYHIMKEPYSAPPANLEGHKTADYVDHRMWTIRSSPHQSIWIGTKHSLVTINHGNGWLSGCTCPKLTVPLSRSSPVVKPKRPILSWGVKLHPAPSPGASNQLE